MNDEPAPLLKRLKINTVAVPDVAQVEHWYSRWLGYAVCERGEISTVLADSWGAAAMAGRPYVVMQPQSGDDVYMRAVEIDPVAGYKPMTTLGWNAFEIIIDDVYELNEQLADSPFRTVGEPAGLGGDLDFIHAMQVEGPGGDLLYLTCDRERAPDTLLPPPGAFIGRPFIVVLAGNGVDKTQSYYCDKFQLKRENDLQTSIGILATAHGLPADHVFDMGFMALGEAGNFIEFDGYGDTFGERKRTAGQLPPGCSSVSFAVDNLDAFNLEFVGDPVADACVAYGGGRCRTATGPVGELIELIEAP